MKLNRSTFLTMEINMKLMRHQLESMEIDWKFYGSQWKA